MVKKGGIPWNKGVSTPIKTRLKISQRHKGRVFTKEWKEKLSEAWQGRVVTASTKVKMSQARFGEKNPSWKGGCRDFVKNQALIRDNYVCQKCGFRDIEIMEVDHIVPRSINPDLEKSLNNLMTLCPNCHKKKTIGELKAGIYRKNRFI